jgi:DNA-binding response OmpR family regulator
LIVTDDLPLLRLLDLALLRAGFTVYCASHGPEAVNIFERSHNEIDVALIEVDMHFLDGVQTMVCLQQTDARLRCCLMTGGEARYTVEEMRAWGALHIFTKPFRNIAQVGVILRAIAEA